MNEGSDDEKPFSSDDDDDLMENTGIKEQSIHQVQLDESADLFDSLKEDSMKEDTPVKKPKVQARKLGAKPEVVKDPSKSGAKRSKKNMSDDDSPIKVNILPDLAMKLSNSMNDKETN